MKKELSIAMTTDQNYILQTRVVIWSILRSASRDTFFKIHILCSPQLAQEDREKVLDLQRKWNNISICFDEIDEKIFKNARTTSYISIATFYRLVISSIVEDDKCLYLDADIIVNTDLTEIYDTDLEGMYLAGVKDCFIQCNMQEYESYKDVLEISTMNCYINAGVVLMNLKEIRTHDMEKVFLLCIDKHYKIHDQDILNKCCYGKIKYLDLKYNFFMDYCGRADMLSHTSFSSREIEDAGKYDGILHFPGKYKPWKFMKIRGSHWWWKNAKEALESQDYDEMYQCAVENMKKNDWKYIFERCALEEDIVIVGFSDIGRDVADSLRRCGINGIKCFCDNSREKQNMKYHDMPVYSVEKAYEKYSKALWVNTSQVSAKIISSQLMDMEVKKEKILVYVHKSGQYYDNLDEQYLEYEKKQLAFKESGREV